MADEIEKKHRTTAKRKFIRCYNRLNGFILNNDVADIIVTKFNELKLCWDDVQSANDDYLFSIYPDENTEIKREDLAWLEEVEEKFEIIQKLKCDYIRKN